MLFSITRRLARRILRKVAENHFDWEVLRSFMSDMNDGDTEHWQEVLHNLETLLEEVKACKEMAEDAVKQLEKPPVNKETPLPEGTNPFAPAKPMTPALQEMVAKEKAKAAK